MEKSSGLEKDCWGRDVALWSSSWDRCWAPACRAIWSGQGVIRRPSVNFFTSPLIFYWLLKIRYRIKLDAVLTDEVNQRDKYMKIRLNQVWYIKYIYAGLIFLSPHDMARKRGQHSVIYFLPTPTLLLKVMPVVFIEILLTWDSQLASCDDGSEQLLTIVWEVSILIAMVSLCCRVHMVLLSQIIAGLSKPRIAILLLNVTRSVLEYLK